MYRFTAERCGTIKKVQKWLKTAQKLHSIYRITYTFIHNYIAYTIIITHYAYNTLFFVLSNYFLQVLYHFRQIP